MPSTLPAEQQRYCLGCGYRLKDLPEPRCPECGEGFDIENRRTYAIRPKPHAFIFWLAIPAGWLTYSVAALLSLVILVSGAVPGQVFIFILPACLGSILLGGVLVLRLLLREYIVRCRGRFRELQGNSWILAPAMLVVAATLSAVHVPLRLGFWISQPAMARFVAEAEPLAPGTRISDRWIGVYPAEWIERTSAGVRFVVRGARVPFGDFFGFAFSRLPLPESDRCNCYFPLGAGWYVWQWRT